MSDAFLIAQAQRQGEYRAEEKTDPQAAPPATPDQPVHPGNAETSG